jgi:hypothetical protein
MRAISIVSLCALAAGCLGALEPDVGPLAGQPCSDADSVPQVDVSFEHDLRESLFVYPPGACLGCHDPAGANNVGYAVGGLDLTSYSGLMAGGVNSGGDIVLPEQPCQSVIYLKVSPAPPFGARMPQNGPPFLEDATTRELADWIAEGAHEN